MKKIFYITIILLVIFPVLTRAQFTGGSGDGVDSRLSHVFLSSPVITSNSPLCTNSGDTLKLSTTCSITGATYYWFGPNNFTSSDKNPIILDPQLFHSGTYGLFVSSSGEFSDTSFIEVLVDTLPYPPSIPSGDNYICFGTVNSPYFASSLNASSYQWTIVPSNAGHFSGDSTVSNVTIEWNPNYSGTASIQVQAVNHCGISDTAALEVLFNPVLGNATIINEDENLCYGITSSSYQLHPAENANGYIWTLSPDTAGLIGSVDDTTISVLWDAEFLGTAILKAAAYNNCDTILSDSVQITINPSPNALIIEDTSICEGAQIALGAAPMANHTYSWTAVPVDPSLVGQNTVSNPLVNPTANTIYYLTETDTLTGCSDFDSVIVAVNYLPGVANLPLALDTICQGTFSSDFIINAVINSTGYIWQLNPVDAGTISFNSGDTSITIFWSSSYIGNASVSVQAYNICDTTQADSTVVTILEIPQAIVIDDTLICYNQSVALGGVNNPAYTYSWIAIPNDPTLTANIANPTVTPAISTWYYLTVSNGYCSVMDSVLVSVTDTLELPTAITGNNMLCQGVVNSDYSTSLTNAIGFVWTLEPTNAGTILGGGTANISILWNTSFIGNVTLSVAGYNVCDTSGYTSLAITVNPVPEFNLCDTCVNDSLGVASFPVIIDAGTGWDSLLWSDGSTTTQTFEVTGPMIIGCTVWLDGCSAYDSLVIYPVGISEILTDNGFALYPNPAENKLYLTHQYKSGMLQYQIIDVNGRTVNSGIINEKSVTIDISTLPAGFYTMQVNASDQIRQTKFIKK